MAEESGTIQKDQPIDPKTIMNILNGALGARMKLWLKSCHHCGLCADSCFFYLAQGKDPKYMPSYKVIKTLGEMFKKKGKVARAFLEETADIAWGNCTACRRCSMYCPFGIDMASMINTVRAVCATYDLSPEALLIATKNYEEFDNQMAVTLKEWTDTCKWIEDREVSHEYANRDLSDSIQSCIRLSGRAASHFLSGGPGYIRPVRFSHIQSRQG